MNTCLVDESQIIQLACMERLNVSFVSSISLPPTLTNPFPLSKMDNGTDSGQELPSKLVPILQ